jgi:hypothetical protein
MTIKSNIDYWNELNQGGKVFSCLQDGLPHGFWENALAFSYPIIICAMIAIGVISMLKFTSSERRWKTYVFSIACGTVLGGIWCFAMQKHDPLYPGWLFAPWSVTGVDFGLILEDWLFLPSATTLFYVVFRTLSRKTPPLAGNRSFYRGTLIAYIGLSVIIFFATATAGKTQILLHMIPGILLFSYAGKSAGAKHFAIFQIFTISFGAVWDLVAVSWIHSIPGLAWASQWSYITYDAAGGYYHSNIFLDYGTHGWAWLFKNPLEITPLMGICGGLLNYAMFIAGDKFFYKNAG